MAELLPPLRRCRMRRLAAVVLRVRRPFSFQYRFVSALLPIRRMCWAWDAQPSSLMQVR